MSDAPAPAPRLSAIRRLSRALAPRILGLGETDCPLDAAEVAAREKAARFLDNYAVPWRSIIKEAIDMLARCREAIMLAPVDATVDA